MDKLKNHLKGTEGSDEIYSDIELRIAELFSAKLSQFNQVIVLKDVEEVITTLGDPKEYVDPENSEHTEEAFDNISSEKQKKIYMRDPGNGMIAGVCAGISAYFGIDLTLVRVLFIIFLLFPGFGGLVYIILWIAAPSAKTAADKLRLKGEPVNIDTLKREVQDAAQRVEEYSKKKFTQERVNQLKDKTYSIGRTIKSIFGFFFVLGAMFGILFFLIFVLSNVGIFTSDDGEQLISMYEFSSVIFTSKWQSIMGWSGILGTVLIPLLTIGLIGVKFLFQLNSSWVKYPSSVLIIFWFLSLGLLTISGLQLGREFSYLGETDEQIGNVSKNKLIVNIPEMYLEEIPSKQKEISSNYIYKPLLELEKDDIKSGMISINLSKSKDSSFHIYRERSSFGITRNKAIRLASNINHKMELNDNELFVSPYYIFPTEDKLRAQRVTIFIEIPEHGEIEWKGNKKQLKIKERFR